MNRVTRLIQKLLFKDRQRRTVDYFRRYIIKEQDIADDAPEFRSTSVSQDANLRGSVLLQQNTYPIAKLWEEFEPENDAWDRRLLYEVTRKKLDESEFESNDSSEDEDSRQSQHIT